LFDLGERAKVVILSVTAEVMILNKIDLLPHVDFDVDQAIANAREVNPGIAVLRVSARSGEGLDAWYAWLRQQRAEAQAAALL
jgi:hydrogenase nickel incorporation protein HypB